MRSRRGRNHAGAMHSTASEKIFQNKKNEIKLMFCLRSVLFSYYLERRTTARRKKLDFFGTPCKRRAYRVLSQKFVSAVGLRPVEQNINL